MSRFDLITSIAAAVRVLIVDDEPIVLRSLARALRPTRWDVVAAGSGAEALSALNGGPFDVLVSDVRMPGIDGVALLERVQRQWPDTLRVVLSGYTDPEAAARLADLAHQYLDKPLRAAELVESLSRLRRVRSLLPPGPLRAHVTAAEVLPCAPAARAEVAAAAADPDLSLAEIERVAGRDPVVAAGLLKLASSSFVSHGQPLSSVRAAIARLGVPAARRVLATAASAAAGVAGPAGQVIDEVAARAVRAAGLVPHLTGLTNDDAFAATMLADLGTIALAAWRPADLLDLAAAAACARRPVEQIERERLGVGHPDLGGYLLGAWGLPDAVVEAVVHHHTPSDAPSLAWHALVPAHVAHALVAGRPIDTDFLARAGVGADDLARWRTILDDAPAPPGRPGSISGPHRAGSAPRTSPDRR